MKFLSEIIEKRELLMSLVRKDLRSRYLHASLGFAWVIINPLILMVVLSLVLGRRSADPNFPIFVLMGLIPWNFFNMTFSGATYSILANADIIKKVYFPRILIPLSGILSSLLHYVLALCVLFIFILIFRVRLTAWALLLPVVLLIQLMFITGLSFLTSALYVRFRDVSYMVQASLLPWFFLSGIFFDYRVYIPKEFQKLFFLNPMAGIIEMYRDILLYGERMAQAEYWSGFALHFWSALIISAVFFVTGIWIFVRRQKFFADYV